MRGLEKQRCNPLEHGIHFVQYLVVPETGDAPSREPEPLRAPAVIRSALDVLSAVELDDEPPLDAREVREPRTDRMLTTEFAPVQLRSAQPMPKTLFRVRGGPPQLPRELDAPHPCPLPAMRGEGVSSLPTRRALGRTTECAGTYLRLLPASPRQLPSPQPSPASGRGSIAAPSLSPLRRLLSPPASPPSPSPRFAASAAQPPSPRIAGRGPG